MRKLFIIIILYHFGCNLSISSKNKEIEKWHKNEIIFVSTKTYDNPIYDVEFFGIELISPSGNKHLIRGFWDGETTWRVRFMPNQIGCWRYKTICSDATNDGLNGKKGDFQCVSNNSNYEIYKRGLLKHPKGTYHLAYNDDKPFLYIGCTAWNGGLFSTPDEWDKYLSNRKENGYSVIQLITTQWRGGPQNAENETAFSGIDTIEINPSFFRRIDNRIDRINELGLVAAPVMLWAYGDSNPGSILPVESAAKLATYILARYDANHVIWNLGGDGQYIKGNETKWKEIGSKVFGENYHNNIVTLHPMGFSWYGNKFNDESWLDMISYQTGHTTNKNAVSWKTQGPVVLEWQNLTPRPIIDTEPAYESENRNNSKVVRNSAYWSIFSTPVAGVSYGSHTIWPWLRKGDKAINHGPKEPSTITWYDALFHEGSIQTGYLASFFRSFEWWKLSPANELLEEQPGLVDYSRWQSVLATHDSKTILVYVPTQDEVKLKDIDEKLYSAKWFDTANNKYIKVKLSQLNLGIKLESPIQSDAVLILTRND